MRPSNLQMEEHHSGTPLSPWSWLSMEVAAATPCWRPCRKPGAPPLVSRASGRIIQVKNWLGQVVSQPDKEAARASTWAWIMAGLIPQNVSPAWPLGAESRDPRGSYPTFSASTVAVLHAHCLDWVTSPADKRLDKNSLDTRWDWARQPVESDSDANRATDEMDSVDASWVAEQARDVPHMPSPQEGRCLERKQTLLGLKRAKISYNLLSKTFTTW